MSRATKGEASAAAATPAADPATTGAADAFNGADTAAFDHDGDGQPGGSVPAELAVVLLKPFEGHARGVVVTGSAVQIGTIPEGSSRPATDRDLAVAGRNIRPL